MPPSYRTVAAHYGLAVLTALVALAARWPLWDPMEGRSPFLTFFPAVVITAYYGGLKPGLVCALLSGLIATYFRHISRDWQSLPPATSENDRYLSDSVSLILFLATCMVMCRLIESLHRARRRLESSQSRSRRLFESDVVGVFHWDLGSGLITDANDFLLRLTGYSRDDLDAGRLTRGALTPPEWVRLDEQDVAGLYERRKGPPAEREYLRKDGGRVPVIVGSALFDDSDREGVSFVLDISKRKSAELATESAIRRQAETLALLDALLDHAPVGFAFFDREHRYVRVNDFLARAGGQAAENYPGRHLLDVTPSGATQIEPVLDRVFRTGETVKNLEVTDEGPAKTGEERIWLTSLYPVRGDAGEVQWVGSVALDVTERKRLMAELRGRAEQLAENDRRKDEFLAMLSHELRNPLAPIRNAVDLLREVGGPELGHARDVVDRQVTHLARLVDDLLDVSRITRGKVALRPEFVDLAEVAERAVETTRPLMEALGHKLELEISEEPPLLYADPTRLGQVVANLLNNAAKYTEKGGLITLRARREGGEAVVRVTDTGAGIPADILPHVFELFAQADRTLDRARGGLGIGLTLVKSLVEQHGGSVQAYSEGPGRGSEFVVRLPIHAGPEPPAAPSAALPPTAAALPQRVLVVDDNADAADTLAMLLSVRGYDVRVARDGPAALGAARDFHPELVLLDIGLPGMDGYAVARALRADQAYNPLRLVALTGYGREEDRRRSAEAGFDHHLVKPVAPEVLLGILAGAFAPSHRG
jgi:PAS domain S-box-containing protein